MTKSKPKKRRNPRPSISVSGQTYDRLNEALPEGNVAAFVDKLVWMGLQDPVIAARVLDQCRREALYS